jgi:hypothetical protein
VGNGIGIELSDEGMLKLGLKGDGVEIHLCAEGAQ